MVQPAHGLQPAALATALRAALDGRAALQDRKKAAQDPQGWIAWESRTSYWPFAAIAQGRAHFGGFGGHAIGGGIVVWLLATWAHIPLAGWAAGIWRWLT